MYFEEKKAGFGKAIKNSVGSGTTRNLTAPWINYRTTQVSLDLKENFVKRLGIGDTFNVIHLFVSW